MIFFYIKIVVLRLKNYAEIMTSTNFILFDLILGGKVGLNSNSNLSDAIQFTYILNIIINNSILIILFILLNIIKYIKNIIYMVINIIVCNTNKKDKSNCFQLYKKDIDS